MRCRNDCASRSRRREVSRTRRKPGGEIPGGCSRPRLATGQVCPWQRTTKRCCNQRRQESQRPDLVAVMPPAEEPRCIGETYPCQHVCSPCCFIVTLELSGR